MADEITDDLWWNCIYEYAHMDLSALFVVKIYAPTKELAIEEADKQLMGYLLLPSNWEFIDCQETTN
jgi:hypothetical protein